jgi:hypothetical protein
MPSRGYCFVNRGLMGAMPTLAVGMLGMFYESHAHDKRGHGTLHLKFCLAEQ